MDGIVREGSQPDETVSLATKLLLQMTRALLAHPPTELTVIEVTDQAGTVTLTGRVSDGQFRAMAEEIATGHPGVSRAVNELEVVRARDPEPE